MAFELKDKIALITGGASGIGFCCVKELLRNGVQAVTIAEIDEKRGQEAIKELTEEFGPNRALFVKTDITKADQLEAAFKATVDTWKVIDIVINNAGIMNDGQWQLEISLNCTALVQGTLTALQYMGKDKGGKGGVIVNMASALGIRPFECLPVYCGTKHFVVGFTRSIGLPYHYERTGVRVLAMCPGRTNTNLLRAAIEYPFSPEIAKRLDMEIKAAPIQSPENVARSMVTVIIKGESGTLWVAEKDKPVFQTALVQGTLTALQYMGKDKGGKGGVIVNMASVLGIQPYDCLPVYCGTKHFVVGFTRSIGLPYHYERTGVRILAMCPGCTNTNLISAAVECPLSPEIAKRLDMAIKVAPVQSPDSVARSMVTVITKGESGTLWVVEEDKPVYQLHIPDRNELPRS